MASSGAKRDKHFPLIGHDNPLRRLFGKPRQYCSYVKQNQTVADLGCGPGFFTFALAESVGPKGQVYAVDSDEKAIRAVKSKAAKRKYHSIEAHASSAADLSFIEDDSVDFVLADGLLCSMAPQDHESTINEIKRVLKPNGKALFRAAKGFISYVDKAEWEKLLEGFEVERRNYESFFEDRWALVSKKHL
ncbi:MAG: class I SAM-dependent methyltransferase [bacterium]